MLPINFSKNIFLNRKYFILAFFSLKFKFSTINAQQESKNYVPKQCIDSEQLINQKIILLAEMIRNSKHPIFFTGAGISTSLGIPDYRSGQNTIINTGPGLWNRSEQEVKKIQQQRNVLIDQLIPSKTHMAIYSLIQSNIFKHVVSQNTDGLHLRSGIKKRNLSQLHGNRNLEYCLKCQRKYLRDFRTLKKTQKHFKPGQKRDHFTGRHCENCNGELHDSIIYFGQKLSRQELVKGYEQGAASDLCIAIGSSLTVKPSSNIPLLPLKYNKQGKLVIINIQQTPLDGDATLKINGFCDNIFQKLMKRVNHEILPFQVQRYLQIGIQKQYSGWNIHVNGLDQHHGNFSFIKNVKILKNSLDKSKKYLDIQKEQATSISELKNKFIFNLTQNDHQNLHHVSLRIHFFGPFPDLDINLKDLKIPEDIIGRQQIITKLISQNNGEWQIIKVQI